MMNTATIIILVLTSANLAVDVIKNGQLRDNYNASAGFCSTIFILILYHFAGLY